MVQKLGKYTLVEKLGEGAMGAVYKAYDAVLDRHVAIKTMAEEIKWDPELKLRFYREARAAANLHHPNIVTIHDLGEEGKTTYIVMELLEGTDLKNLISDRVQLTLEKKLHFVAQIADGLDHAHKQGIIHRDIKPGNIHVGSSGNVKIMDFGIARLPSSDLTRAGARLGTPVYMSPEQIRGESYDERSDMFSTGIVFYELITYIHPFRDKKISKTLDNILHQEQFQFDQQFPDAPAGLWLIISTCLAKEAAKRYTTMADLGRACRALLTELALARQKMSGEVEAALHRLRQGVTAPETSERLQRILHDAPSLLEREREPDYLALLRVARALMAETSWRGSASPPKSPPHGPESVTRAGPAVPTPLTQLPRQGERGAALTTEQPSGVASVSAGTDSPAIRTSGLPSAAAPSAGTRAPASIPREEIERRGREMVQAAEQMLREDKPEEALDQLRGAISTLGARDELVRMLADARKRSEEKKRVRIAALLETANAALASGQSDKALEAAGEILALDPEKSEAMEIRRQARTHLEAEKARQAKREEGEREKALGLQLLVERKYQESLKALRRAAEILTDDPTIKPRIEEAENGLRAEDLRARTQLEISEALRLFRTQDFEQARAHVSRALESSPENPEALELLARIEGAQQEKRKQDSVAALLRQSREAIGRREFDAALSAANEAGKLEPSNTQIGPLLDQILAAKEGERRKEEAAELLSKANAASGSGNLEDAEYYARQALAVVPGSPGALECLKHIDKAKRDRARAAEIADLAAEAEQALRQGNPELSDSRARRILELEPENSKAKDLLGRAAQMREKNKADRIRELLEQARTALSAGEVLRASNYARDVLVLDGKNVQAQKLLSSLEEAQKMRKQEEVTSLLSRSRESLRQGRVQEAAQLAQNAAALDPNNKEVKSLLKEIDKTSRTLEKDKGRIVRDRIEEKPAPPAAQDSADDLETTIKLKRPLNRRRIVTAGIAAGVFVAVALVLGSWFLSRHKNAAPDPTVRLAEARTYLEQKKYDQAIGIARDVLISSPGNKQAEALLADAEKQKRQAVIEVYMQEAARLLQQSQLAESDNTLQKVLDIDPSYQPALSLRSEIQALISSSKSKEDQDRTIKEWAQNAETLLAAGKLPEARSEIDKIEKLRPDAAELPALRKRLSARGAELERGKEEQAEVAKKRNRMGDLSQKASELFRQGKYAESQGVLDQWLNEAPADAQAQNLRSQANEALRSLRIYESSLGAKQYDAALQALSRLERINPADPTLGDRRKRAEASKAAAKATFSVYRLGEPGVLTLDSQHIGTNGEVEGEVVKAGPHKLTVEGAGGKEGSISLEFIDGQNLVFVYDAATAELRPAAAADKDALALRKQREEVRRYPVEHLHGFLKGKCTGVLLISGVKVEYKPSEGPHNYSIPYKNLRLSVSQDKLEFVESPGNRVLQFKVRDAKQAEYIGRLFTELGKLGK